MQIIGRRLQLNPAALGVLDLLQENDVGIVPANLGQRHLKIDRCTQRVGLIPDLAKLHVKLEHAETAHGRARGWGRAAAGVLPTGTAPSAGAAPLRRKTNRLTRAVVSAPSAGERFCVVAWAEVMAS